MYIIGASGTGKSTLIVNLAAQSIKAGEGIAVLDPHGDLIDEIIKTIPDDRIDDVILFDPADDEYPIPFNILAAHSDLERICCRLIWWECLNVCHQAGATR